MSVLGKVLQAAGITPGQSKTDEQVPKGEFPKRLTEEPAETEATDEEIVRRGYALFEEFRRAYIPEWQRQDHNEKLYRCEHWDEVIAKDPGEPTPTTPMVQSIVENVQADLMDAYPQAVVRPENPEDMDVADTVGALIKQNHDAQNFRAEYRKMAHDLLLQGWCVSESGYDTHAYNNIGMGFIRHVNCRSILFDPQTDDIQDGRAVFKIDSVPIHRLEQMYPAFKGRFESDTYDLQTNRDGKINRDERKNVLRIEYWWREFDHEAGLWRVHMVQMAGHKLLEDSRREKPEGYFSMGVYPFAVTVMLPRKGSSLGMGFGDAFGPAQVYTDKMDQIVMKNAFMASHGKMLVTESSGFDVADLQDWSKEVHRGEQLGGIQWLPIPPLPQYIVNYTQAVRQIARDESGANDFSRGNTASGVTAASAIAALQEASGKRSRMINQQLHESYKEAVRMEIEFEREYNLLPRTVMVKRNNEDVAMTFQSAIMERMSDTGIEVPVEFFISIKVETERKWQTTTQNELMLQLMQMQVIPPMMCVENMVFEGKEQILKEISEQQKKAEEEQAQQAQMAAMMQGQPPQESPEQRQASEMLENLPAPESLGQAQA